MDFSSGQDGSRHSRAYSPASGGRFERDRFAVTKITEELLENCEFSNEVAGQIARSIEECRMGPPANGTLLPLREAIERVQNSHDDDELTTYNISLIQTEVGPMHPDEGLYWVAKTNRGIRIIGAVEELSIELNSDGVPVKAWRNPLEQAQNHRLLHQKICSFRAKIRIEKGLNRLDDISSILQLSDVAAALATPLSSPKEIEDEVDVSQIASIEAKEDDLVKREQSEQSDAPVSIDVPLLWERYLSLGFVIQSWLPMHRSMFLNHFVGSMAKYQVQKTRMCLIR